MFLENFLQLLLLHAAFDSLSFLGEGPNFTLTDEPSQDITVDSISWSVVARYPEKLLGELPWGMESITGYTIIEGESLDDAESIARDNPYIASIRVYEVREM